MRARLALVALVVVLTAVGCYHDKYDVNGPKRGDDYYLPPDEPRYNEPDTATYRKPPAPKQQDTLSSKMGGGGGGGRMSGNGLGGF